MYNQAMTDKEIMKELIEYAYQKMTKNNAYPFCAFIVRNGVVVSRGYNLRVNLYGDKTMHGEMESLSKANRALRPKNLVFLGKEYELFTTCEPCLACFDTTLWTGIRKIVFSVDHHDFPEYFHDHPYNTEDYEKDNPGEITIIRSLLHDKGVELFKEAKKNYGW